MKKRKVKKNKYEKDSTVNVTKCGVFYAANHFGTYVCLNQSDYATLVRYNNETSSLDNHLNMRLEIALEIYPQIVAKIYEYKKTIADKIIKKHVYHKERNYLMKDMEVLRRFTHLDVKYLDEYTDKMLTTARKKADLQKKKIMRSKFSAITI